jgi:hypothetical protein
MDANEILGEIAKTLREHIERIDKEFEDIDASFGEVWERLDVLEKEFGKIGVTITREPKNPTRSAVRWGDVDLDEGH